MTAEQQAAGRPTVCIAGGGPADIVLGLLLARTGIRTTVLEKHDDFVRGDTMHPSTTDLIDQLGLRDALGLRPKKYGVPVDVVWFRLPEPDAPMPDTLIWASAEALIVTIPRPGYYQCGLLIPKGSFEGVRRAGIGTLRERVAAIVPRLPTAAMQVLQRGLHRTIASGRGVRLLDSPPTRAQRTVSALLPLAARVVKYVFRRERLRARARLHQRQE